MGGLTFFTAVVCVQLLMWAAICGALAEVEARGWAPARSTRWWIGNAAVAGTWLAALLIVGRSV